MKLNKGKFGEFIPSWQGNEALPEDEKIIIKYKRMTGEMASSTMKFLVDGSAMFDYPRITKMCVMEIKNLIDSDDNKIKTAQELLNATGTHGLVTEIGSHIINDSKLDIEVEKKNKNSTALDE